MGGARGIFLVTLRSWAGPSGWGEKQGGFDLGPRAQARGQRAVREAQSPSPALLLSAALKELGARQPPASHSILCSFCVGGGSFLSRGRLAQLQRQPRALWKSSRKPRPLLSFRGEEPPPMSLGRLHRRLKIVCISGRDALECHVSPFLRPCPGKTGRVMSRWCDP